MNRVISMVYIAFLAGSAVVEASPSLEAILDNPARKPEHRDRDDYRKPAKVIEFSGLKPGDEILELAPAGGYYTAILSRFLGSQGKLYAVDPARIFEYFPGAKQGFQDFIQGDPLNNVEYSIQKYDEITVPAPVDQIWVVLYYHDTIWTGENREQMNRRFYELLKPGGHLLVLDHSGLPGDQNAISKELHRMNPDVAMNEILKAGFLLDKKSDLFENPDDPKNDSVFSEGRRGQTDRFLWRFYKPAS